MVWCTARARARPTAPRSPPHHMTTASFQSTPVPNRRRIGKKRAIVMPREKRMICAQPMWGKRACSRSSENKAVCQASEHRRAEYQASTQLFLGRRVRSAKARAGGRGHIAAARARERRHARSRGTHVPGRWRTCRCRALPCGSSCPGLTRGTRRRGRRSVADRADGKHMTRGNAVRQGTAERGARCEGWCGCSASGAVSGLMWSLSAALVAAEGMGSRCGVWSCGGRQAASSAYVVRWVVLCAVSSHAGVFTLMPAMAKMIVFIKWAMSS
jgi:hypothetical protein